MKTKLIVTVYICGIEKLRLTKLSCIDTTPLFFSEEYCKTVEVGSVFTEEGFQELEKSIESDEKLKSFGWTVERL